MQFKYVDVDKMKTTANRHSLVVVFMLQHKVII